MTSVKVRRKPGWVITVGATVAGQSFSSRAKLRADDIGAVLDNWDGALSDPALETIAKEIEQGSTDVTMIEIRVERAT